MLDKLPRSDLIALVKTHASTSAERLIEIERLSAENERLTKIADAGEKLYQQCHNIKTATPRWANESVCEAMRDFGKALTGENDKH